MSAGAPPLPATPPKDIRVKGAVEQANLIQKVQLVYPPTAKAVGIQGTVLFEMVISKAGVSIDIRVIESRDDDITQSLTEAVRPWRYKPTLLYGNPVEVRTELKVNYAGRIILGH